ncbi:hypothetical protein [Methanocaldococcus fervens]|uniref:Uncharacterized protein n=1 Tax=Methanocaldococcus fervens (strain DSM 4213 / JCM 15782 / AG86) TaxID=573064 RepID=C7P6D3_METFA|nr:hypothetical protein [Methanocaldococcus fervens]ACV24115.1 hypothetical protein Mefer_0278 [Methanocaldococcus fervens AG86]
MSVDVNNLLRYTDEILKAEIVSLFTLLDKTFVSWWQSINSEYFKGITPKYSNEKDEIKNLLSAFFNDLKINIDGLNIKDKDGNVIDEVDALNDFINENWRNWRGINLKENPKKNFTSVVWIFRRSKFWD